MTKASTASPQAERWREGLITLLITLPVYAVALFGFLLLLGQPGKHQPQATPLDAQIVELPPPPPKEIAAAKPRESAPAPQAAPQVRQAVQMPVTPTPPPSAPVMHEASPPPPPAPTPTAPPPPAAVPTATAEPPPGNSHGTPGGDTVGAQIHCVPSDPDTYPDDVDIPDDAPGMTINAVYTIAANGSFTYDITTPYPKLTSWLKRWRQQHCHATPAMRDGKAISSTLPTQFPLGQAQ